MSTGPGDPHVGAFYGHLVARGKARMQAVVAVMRKLLHAMWGMLRSESTWQGERFYGGRVDSVVSATGEPELPAPRGAPSAHRPPGGLGATRSVGQGRGRRRHPGGHPPGRAAERVHFTLVGREHGGRLTVVLGCAPRQRTNA